MDDCLQGGNAVETLNAHTAEVSSLDFSSDGKFFASGSYDGSMILWDKQRKRKIASFLSFEDDEWLVITADGYFNASSNAAKYFSARTLSNKPIDMPDYYETYHRPDIVKLILAGQKY